MTEAFDAGSIRSALKVEIDSLESGLKSAGVALDHFADQSEDSAQTVDRAGLAISSTFDTLATKSTAFAKEFQVKWTQNSGAVTSAARSISAVTTDLGAKFEIINRQNARLAQEFQNRWKQNQAAAAAGSAEIAKGADAFGAIDRNALRATERFSRLTNRLVGIQFAMQSLHGESSKAGKAFEIATKGLGIFASTALLIPGPVGLAAGAFLGLVVAFRAATAAGKDTAEALKNAKAAVEGFKSGQREREFESKVAKRLGELFPGQEDLQILSKAADQIALIKRITTEQVALEDEITDLHKKRKELQTEELSLDTMTWDPIVNAINAIRRKSIRGEIDTLDKQILQVMRNLPRVNQALKESTQGLDQKRMNEALKDIMKMSDEFSEQVDDLKTQRTILPEFIAIQRQRLEIEQKISEATKGIKDPVALNNARLQRERAGDLAVMRAGELRIQEQLKLHEKLKDAGQDLEEQISPLTKIQEIEKLRKEIVEDIVKLKKSELFVVGATLKDAEIRAIAEKHTKKEFEDAIEKAKRLDFQTEFSQPFSSAIAGGFADGLKEGAKAFEVVADIGERLFGNMVNQFAANLEKNLSSAFTSVFGAAGSALSTLFTGIAGIVGLFMSRGKSKSSMTFDETVGRIESSQAVRGIVAGPQSVAIAAVGEDLSRALIPTNEILTEILYAIRSGGRTSSGSRAAGGFDFVAAPTA